MKFGVKTGLRKLAYTYLRHHHRWRGCPAAYLLVLSHMRSGSSLFHRLLVAHPQISGAGERNTVYRQASDLERLAQDAYYVPRQFWGRVKYAADQLNHDHLIADDRLLLRGDVQVIFLVRRPGPSVRSMVQTFQPTYGDWPLSRAVAYYADRLTTLTRQAEFLKQAGRRLLLVKYERLTGASRSTLTEVSQFLRLQGPLSERYRVRAFRGRGDDGPSIHAGTIVSANQHTLPLSAEEQLRVDTAYRRLLTQLES